MHSRDEKSEVFIDIIERLVASFASNVFYSFQNFSHMYINIELIKPANFYIRE